MKSLSFATPVAVLIGSLAFAFSTAFRVLPPTLTPISGSISVHINGMDNSKGVVRVVLYNSEKTFLSENVFSVADSVFAPATGSGEVTLHNVPFGTYAAAFYQDENQNGVIDMNMLHVPTEPYAFSNDVRAKWSVPDFNKVAFRFEQPNMSLDVTLHDWSQQ